MRRLGWTEGQNVRKLPELANELVRLSVDVVVAVNTPASLAAKRATTTIPIVIAQVGDPVAVGLVTNLARPGGNITGFSNLVGEITSKRMELLAEVLSRPARIALVANSNDPVATVQIKDAEVAGRHLRLETRVFEVRRPEDLEPAFDAMLQWRATGAIRMADSLMWSLRTQAFDLATRHRLPIMYVFRTDTEDGGLMSYGPDGLECFTRAPEYVDRILKGARAADLPVQRPTRLEFAINLKAARAIGVTFRPELRARADVVIE